ncbi:MAG: polyketide synthase, partial [Nocardia sp.]|nr:polyketide synthase [Nocardia sp.]
MSSPGSGGCAEEVVAQPNDNERAPGSTRFDGGGARLPAVPWVLSGRSGAALAGQATRLLEHLREKPDLDPVDVGFSLVGRSLFEHRAVVVGGDRDELMRGLSELVDGAPGRRVVRG